MGEIRDWVLDAWNRKLEKELEEMGKEFSMWDIKSYGDSMECLAEELSHWDDMLYDDGTVYDLTDAFVAFAKEQYELGEYLYVEAVRDSIQDMGMFIQYSMATTHWYQVKDGEVYLQCLPAGAVELDYDKWMIKFRNGKSVDWTMPTRDVANLLDSDELKYVQTTLAYRDMGYKELFKLMLEMNTFVESIEELEEGDEIYD